MLILPLLFVERVRPVWSKAVKSDKDNQASLVASGSATDPALFVPWRKMGQSSTLVAPIARWWLACYLLVRLSYCNGNWSCQLSQQRHSSFRLSDDITGRKRTDVPSSASKLCARSMSNGRRGTECGSGADPFTETPGERLRNAQEALRMFSYMLHWSRLGSRTSQLTPPYSPGRPARTSQRTPRRGTLQGLWRSSPRSPFPDFASLQSPALARCCRPAPLR